MNSSRLTPVDEEPRAVLARYPIVGLSVAPAISHLGPGRWLVRTPSGTPTVLRRLSTGFSRAQAEYVTTVYECAARAGFAPQLLPNEMEEPLTFHGGGFYQLTHAAGGVHPSRATRRRDLCDLLGRALGRLHRSLTAVTPTLDVPRLTFPSPPIAALELAYAQHDHPRCPHVAVREALAMKLRRAQTITPAVLGRLAHVPGQAIHGDVHPGNIFVDATSRSAPLVAFIDFDLAKVAPPGYELIRGLIYCLDPQEPHFWDATTAFLLAYFAAMPLGEEHVASMVQLYETVQILDPHGLDVCDNASDGLLRFGLARFALLGWLQQHGETLARLAQSASHPCHRAATTRARSDRHALAETNRSSRPATGPMSRHAP